MTGKNEYVRALGTLIYRLKSISPQTIEYMRLNYISLAALSERSTLEAANDFVIEMFGIPSEYKQHLARAEDYERIAARKIGEWKSLKEQIIEMFKIINPRMGRELHNDVERAGNYITALPKNLSKDEAINSSINMYKKYVEAINRLFETYYSRL